MDSLHEIVVSATASKVFDAWTAADGLRGWWTADVSEPRAKGQPYVFGFNGGRVKFHFRVDEHLLYERVLWTGVKGAEMPAEWVGTQIDVRLSKAADGGTRLQFAHRNWQSIEGAFCVCNTTWGELMYRLKDFCEGRPRGPLFAG